MKVSKVPATAEEDAALDAAIASHDKRRALTLLMARHGDEVYRYAVAMTRDRSVAEEVRQQVFAEAYRDLDRVDSVTSLSLWIFGIARHRCIDAVNARKRWTQRYKNDPPDDLEQVDGAPDHELDRERLARILAACLERLAPAARDAVVLRYTQELSYDDAAAIVGDRPGTLQRRVARALPVLRRCVEANLQRGESR
jgi:RNA polymerase sigma-70 factor (ECF subfamily)